MSIILRVILAVAVTVVLLPSDVAWGQNLLSNGSFESGTVDGDPVDWTVVQTGHPTEPVNVFNLWGVGGEASADPGAHGPNYLGVRPDDADPGLGDAIVQQFASPAQLGLTYTLDLKQLRRNGGANKNFIYSIGYDSGGGTFVELASATHSTSNAANRNVWLDLPTLTHAVVPGDAVPGGANIGVRVRTTASAPLRVFVDDVNLTEGFAPIDPFGRIDIDGDGASVFNGSFEDITYDSGDKPTAKVTGSSTSFDPHDEAEITVTGWSPWEDDPNNMVGRYGNSGTITDNSWYLDTVSHGTLKTEGSRAILLNSADNYKHGLVNEDFLSSVDAKFKNPNAQYKVTADAGRNSASTLANDTANATIAITEGTTDTSDISNAISGGVESVVQESIPVGLGNAHEFSLTLSGDVLFSATQKNLVIQTVNTRAIGTEGTPGQDLTYTSQIIFDNIQLSGYLPGDSDDDWDVDGDDYAAWEGGKGTVGTGSYFTGDFNADLNVDDADFAIWKANFTGLKGDYNDSGQVEQGDLDLVLLNWGGSVPPNPALWINDQPSPDTIDQDDLDRVLLNWGNSAAAVNTAAVPEPSSATLLVLLAAAGSFCRSPQTSSLLASPVAFACHAPHPPAMGGGRVPTLTVAQSLRARLTGMIVNFGIISGKV